MLRMSCPELLITQAYLNGEWVNRSKLIAVSNPSTGEVLAKVPNCSVEDAAKAIDAAAVAQKDWARRTGKERAAILRRWHDLMVQHADDLAVILTSEMGKPLAEAKGEILYGASYFEWFAEEAKRTYGDVIPGHQRDKRVLVLKQPVGVVGAIHPMEFPKRDDRTQGRPGVGGGLCDGCQSSS